MVAKQSDVHVTVAHSASSGCNDGQSNGDFLHLQPLRGTLISEIVFSTLMRKCCAAVKEAPKNKSVQYALAKNERKIWVTEKVTKNCLTVIRYFQVVSFN